MWMNRVWVVKSPANEVVARVKKRVYYRRSNAQDESSTRLRHHIKNAGTKELKPFFERRVSPKAHV
jgi:hypothetical protein